MASEKISSCIYNSLKCKLEDLVKNIVNQEIEALKSHLLKKGIPQDALDKHLGDFSRDKVVNVENVIIVQDYSDKRHALFGKIPEDFTNAVLRKNSLYKFNERLAYGAGWTIIKNDTSLDETQKLLHESNISFEIMTYSEFEDTFKKEKNKKKYEKRGEYLVLCDTNYVIDEFSSDGKHIQLIIGYLVDNKVVKLTEDQINECKSKEYKILDLDIVNLVKGKRKIRYMEILEMSS